MGVTQQLPYAIDTPGEIHCPSSPLPMTDHQDNIRKSAATIAWDMLQYYHGNESGKVPGILPGPPASGEGPYYWWQGGAMWGTLIDYWYLTGDDTYNDLVKQSMLFQVGPNRDYMPPNYTITMGNDDQGFWGMSAMVAAETKFPDPPKDEPQWLALAQAVFNSMATPDRWQEDTCGGGLRWQVPFSNLGYNYKNSISNGCFFNLGARLARYTGNETYAKWADKTWDWMLGVGFMGKDNEALYDGAHVETNCTDINRQEYSYNNAVFTLGAAHMYNYVSCSSFPSPSCHPETDNHPDQRRREMEDAAQQAHRPRVRQVLPKGHCLRAPMRGERDVHHRHEVLQGLHAPLVRHHHARRAVHRRAHPPRAQEVGRGGHQGVHGGPEQPPVRLQLGGGPVRQQGGRGPADERARGRVVAADPAVQGPRHGGHGRHEQGRSQRRVQLQRRDQAGAAHHDGRQGGRGGADVCGAGDHHQHVWVDVHQRGGVSDCGY